MQKQVSFKNSKGQRLVGVLNIPPGKGPFPGVILVHGFSTGYEINHIVNQAAQKFYKADFITLRFNFSSYPPSSGTYQQCLINQFVSDLKKALDFLKKQPKVSKNRIGLAGHSLGGYDVLMAAVQFQGQFRPLVTFASVYDFESVLKNYFKAGKINEIEKDFWIVNGKKVTTKFMKGKFFNPTDNIFKRISCPTLLIHGTKDQLVPFISAKKIFNLLECPKELKMIKNSSHSFKSEIFTKQAVSAALRWFNKYLKKRKEKVVSCYVEYQGKILLLKRSNRVGNYKNCWSAVGGYLEEGEISLKAAKREIREELNVKVTSKNHYKVGKPYIFDDKKNDLLLHLHPVLFSLKRKPKIKIDWEHTAYQWVSLKDIFKYKKINPHLKLDLINLGLIKK
ncbi:prolyl oligopeptidase family serine peptidase [Patescibacteria group bacterium]|nr:prolyl oligopeptidase family serine peptidase [Patescibacteria group bacterium]